MNVSFTPDIIQPILAEACVSISNLKKNPAAVIAAAREQQVAILNRNKPVAYVISPEVWELLTDVYADMKDGEEAMERLAEGEEGVEVTLEELRAGIPEEGGAGVE